MHFFGPGRTNGRTDTHTHTHKAKPIHPRVAGCKQQQHTGPGILVAQVWLRRIVLGWTRRLGTRWRRLRRSNLSTDDELYNGTSSSITHTEPITRSSAHFSIPHWSSSVEFGITGYYYPGRLRHTGSQDTDLNSYMLIFTFCCTM